MHFLKTNFDKVRGINAFMTLRVEIEIPMRSFITDWGTYSGLMKTSKTQRPKRTWAAWVVWAVWAVACPAWKVWVAWEAWVETEASAVSVCKTLFPQSNIPRQSANLKPPIDFSKLGGGAGGMPDMGDDDLGKGLEEGDGDDDEEMPELEDDEAEGDEGKGKGKAKEAEEPASSAKIEEVA